MTNPTTKAMVEFDPLQALEDVTGKDYHDQPELSLLAHMVHCQRKNAHLLAEGDTVLQNDLDRYMAIIGDLGFVQVADVPFTVPGWTAEDPPRAEHYYMFANREKGILLGFDTYDEVRVNGGKFYYCWAPNEEKCRADHVRPTASGSYHMKPGVTRETATNDDYFWAGDHDCREAIRYHISQLEEYGSFIPTWPDGHDQLLWLLHHGDTKVNGYDLPGITAERLALLPQWVREMINVDSLRSWRG